MLVVERHHHHTREELLRRRGRSSPEWISIDHHVHHPRRAIRAPSSRRAASGLCSYCMGWMSPVRRCHPCDAETRDQAGSMSTKLVGWDDRPQSSIQRGVPFFFSRLPHCIAEESQQNRLVPNRCSRESSSARCAALSVQSSRATRRFSLARSRLRDFATGRKPCWSDHLRST